MDRAISTSTPSEETTLEPWSGPPLVGVEGTPLNIRGVAQASMSLAGRSFKPDIVIVDDLSAKAILGRDFLEEHNCTLDLFDRTLRFGHQSVGVPLQPPPKRDEDHREQLVKAMMIETHLIPPLIVNLRCSQM